MMFDLTRLPCWPRPRCLIFKENLGFQRDLAGVNAEIAAATSAAKQFRRSPRDKLLLLLRAAV
jgi:hypothetical protein